MLLSNEQIRTLKQVNVSKDADKTKERVERDFKASSRADKRAIQELSGQARTAIYRVFKTGSVNARIVVSMAQILNVAPSYYTGESDEKQPADGARLKSFLESNGYGKLAAELGAGEPAPKRKYTRRPKVAADTAEPQTDQTEEISAEEPAARHRPESVMSLLDVKPLELRLGYGLLSLADTANGGDLIERVLLLRRELALDLGVIVPPIHLRDDVTLGANKYALYIKGTEVAQCELMPGHLLAFPTEETETNIDGIPATDPVFGIPALWIPADEREAAEALGYYTNDLPTIIVTHLSETLRSHAHELLSRELVQALVDNLRRTQPTLVDEVIPKLFSLGELQKVLAALLKTDVPIRDLATILETLEEYGAQTRDTELLAEYARQALPKRLHIKLAGQQAAAENHKNAEPESLDITLTFINNAEMKKAVTELSEDDAKDLLHTLFIRAKGGGEAAFIAEIVKRCLLK